jgi:hypothetical protein
MKLKYTGLTPITNLYGDWKPGEIKEVPQDANLVFDFIRVDEHQQSPIKAKVKITRKIRRQELADKMERDNKQIIQQED